MQPHEPDRDPVLSYTLEHEDQFWFEVTRVRLGSRTIDVTVAEFLRSLELRLADPLRRLRRQLQRRIDVSLLADRAASLRSLLSDLRRYRPRLAFVRVAPRTPHRGPTATLYVRRI